MSLCLIQPTCKLLLGPGHILNLCCRMCFRQLCRRFPLIPLTTASRKPRSLPHHCRPLRYSWTKSHTVTMSWKFAELKWRQDLGIYESWDGRDVDWLPLERKRAIRAFQQRQVVSHPHRKSNSLQHFPIQQVTRDGSDGNSEEQTSPALPALPSERDKKASNIEKWCKQNKEDFLQPSALDCRAGEDTLSSVQRSHSLSAIKNRPGQVQAAPTGSEDENLQKAAFNHKEDSELSEWAYLLK
jgi:hypothetical protein